MGRALILAGFPVARAAGSLPVLCGSFWARLSVSYRVSYILWGAMWCSVI